MSEVIHLLGEGGAVWEMTLPLERNIADRLEAGEIVRVNPDGTAWGGQRPKRARRSAGPRHETMEAFGD